MKISPLIKQNKSYKPVFQKSQSAQLPFKNAVQYSEFSKISSSIAKNNALFLINFKGKNKNLSLEDIISKLKKEYKINAQFSNPDTAKLFLEAVEDFVKLNSKDMFEGLVIKDYKNSFFEDTMWEIQNTPFRNSFVIGFNNSYSKEEIKDMASKEYNSCTIGADNPKYYFYEALGEFLCHKYNPYAYNFFSNCAPQIPLAKRICNNAAKTCTRYNSSYIASRMSGKNYPKELQNNYEIYLGADINFPKKPKPKTNKASKPDSKFDSIDDFRKYLKKNYNIKADFENLTVANLVTSAIERFH